MGRFRAFSGHFWTFLEVFFVREGEAQWCGNPMNSWEHGSKELRVHPRKYPQVRGTGVSDP